MMGFPLFITGVLASLILILQKWLLLDEYREDVASMPRFVEDMIHVILWSLQNQWENWIIFQGKKDGSMGGAFFVCDFLLINHCLWLIPDLTSEQWGGNQWKD